MSHLKLFLIVVTCLASISLAYARGQASSDDCPVGNKDPDCTDNAPPKK